MLLYHLISVAVVLISTKAHQKRLSFSCHVIKVVHYMWCDISTIAFPLKWCESKMLSLHAFYNLFVTNLLFNLFVFCFYSHIIYSQVILTVYSFKRRPWGLLGCSSAEPPPEGSIYLSAILKRCLGYKRCESVRARVRVYMNRYK